MLLMWTDECHLITCAGCCRTATEGVGIVIGIRVRVITLGVNQIGVVGGCSRTCPTHTGCNRGRGASVHLRLWIGRLNVMPGKGGIRKPLHLPKVSFYEGEEPPQSSTLGGSRRRRISVPRV